MRDMNNRDPIEHVVVLMLENRSFDQMLGAFQTVHDGLDGVDANSPLTFRDDDGKEYEQKPTAAMIVSHDPHHDLDSVLRQIGAPPAVEGRDLRGSRLRRFVASLQQAGWGIFYFLWGLWRNYRRRPDRAPAQAMMAPAASAYGERFVAEYVRTYPDLSKEAIEQIMAYFPVDGLPALHALARGFTVCDRWFSSVPGPTWTNRFFLHSGTSMGVTSMPEGNVSLEGIDLYEQRTIYDELNRVGKPWRIYFDDVPQSLALIHQWRPENRKNYLPIDEFEQDAAKAASKFPAFVVIEPRYLGAIRMTTIHHTTQCWPKG